MITRKHDARDISTHELAKLEKELGKRFGAYSVVTIQHAEHRLSVRADAYRARDGIEGKPVARYRGSLALSDARPLQTVIYWAVCDLYWQLENEEVVRTAQSPTEGIEELPF